jgi:hypothetical protein
MELPSKRVKKEELNWGILFSFPVKKKKKKKKERKKAKKKEGRSE